jgi:hypothetical protein
MFGMRRKKLDAAKQREIAQAVISGRKTAAQMAWMFGVSPSRENYGLVKHRSAYSRSGRGGNDAG